jgi:hypothetical protein
MTTHLLAILVGLAVGGLTFARLFRQQRDEGCPA